MFVRRRTYLYRTIDKRGFTVDFLLSEHHDIAAAKQFFAAAIKQHGALEKITVDGYPATHSAISELKREEVLPSHTLVRTSKYLNNLIEQDHRRVKQQIYPMLGFKRFQNAVITISGIELAHQIRKEQFDTAKFNRSGGGASQMWEAVLAA